MGNQKGKDRTSGGGRDDYETDTEFFDIVNHEFNFQIDFAASNFNAKCKHFFSKETDSLSVQWCHHIAEYSYGWLNPPYSRGVGPEFIKKCYEESQHGVGSVVLVHTCTDTKYWREHVWNKAAEVRHIQGRLRFWRPEPDENGKLGGTSDLPHSLIIYRPNYSIPYTNQITWNWKQSYIDKIGPSPIRSIKTREIVKYQEAA